MKLKPSQRKILEFVRSVEDSGGCVQLLQIAANGRSELNKLDDLRQAGYVRFVDHPTVMNGKYPAEGVLITEAGRQALGLDPRADTHKD